MNFVSKEAQNVKIVAAILNSAQPGSIFLTSFYPRDFVQMASDKTFNYHSWLWLPWSHIILNQTCSKLQNDSIKDSKVAKNLEKNSFADLVKDVQ